MNKIIVISLMLTIGLISCQTKKKDIDHLNIAKQYYKALDKSDCSEIVTLLTDSIVIRENEYDYQEIFSRKGYAKWLKWDAVFNPTYKILEIEQENSFVKAKISKVDERILFLNEEPVVWNETIQFDNNKIVKIERTKYLTFNDSLFTTNRDELSSWINEYHPELNGFLFDQSEAGGIRYLNAIELYRNK